MVCKTAWGLLCLLLFAGAIPRTAPAGENLPPTIIRAYEVRDEPKVRTYIESHSGDVNAALKLRRRLIELGAGNVNLFLPALIVCDLPRSLNLGEVAGVGDFVTTDESHLSGSPAAGQSSRLAWARECYRRVGSLAGGVSGAVAPGQGFRDSVRVIPRRSLDDWKMRQQRAPGGPYPEARSLDQNAEFMAGDILMHVIMPDGPHQDWTSEDLRDASMGAVTALLKFQERFNNIRMDFVFQMVEEAVTLYEPIEHNMDTDHLWVLDVMKNLGFEDRDDLFTVHAFNNWGRKRYGTDWAFTAFVANSRSEPGNIFRNANYTAYANLGGPYMVMPHPAGVNETVFEDWEIYSAIFQHEAGHIFWALDEYPSAPSGCTSRSGYLNYQNQNKVLVLPDNQRINCFGNAPIPCVMHSPRDDMARPVCQYTAGQMGLVDANDNSVPDVFDRPPTVVFESAEPETVFTPEVTVEMKAISQAVRNRNPAQDEASKIHYAPPLKDATLSVGGVGAIQVLPVDGKWDETEEDISLSITGLSAGVTEVGIKVRNAYGRSSAVLTQRVYFIGLRFTLFHVNVRNDGMAVSWSMVGNPYKSTNLDLYRIENTAGRQDTTRLTTVNMPLPEGGTEHPFFPYTYFDDNVKPGHQYGYFISGHFPLTIGSVTREHYSISEPVQVTATFPIASGTLVSSAAPNPFSGGTTVSIDVPPTRVKNPNSSGEGFADILVPTDVSVNIYDVLGRFVKQVYAGSVLTQRFTLTWDGTNQRNERVPSGIYFIKANAGRRSEVKKVVIVR
jgi:hypothetical protein